MKFAEDPKVNVIGLAVGLLWAALISHFIDVGPMRYAKAYPADTLCVRVKQGMAFEELNKVLSSLGESHSITLLGDRIIVEGSDTTCNIQLDSTRTAVEKKYMSDPLVIK